MKKFAVLLLSGVFFALSVPAFAEVAKDAKDECLLASKNCMNEVDSLQKQVKKLQAEVKKGSKVYTAEELQTLEKKIKELNDFMKTMGKSGGK
jgi:peptidoglycan hydrolase CwlO-like protein